MTPDPATQAITGPVTKRHRKRRANRNLSKASVVFLWLAGSLLTIGGVGAMTYYSSRPTFSPTLRAINTAEIVIRNHFAEGTVVTFSPVEWTRVEAHPMSKYAVSGWGRAVNADGVKASFTYNSTVSVTNGRWAVDSLNMLPQ